MNDYILYSNEQDYINCAKRHIRFFLVISKIVRVMGFLISFLINNNSKEWYKKELKVVKKLEFKETHGGHFRPMTKNTYINLPSISRVTQNEDKIIDYMITILNHEDIHKALCLLNTQLDKQHYATEKLGYEIND